MQIKFQGLLHVKQATELYIYNSNFILRVDENMQKSKIYNPWKFPTIYVTYSGNCSVKVLANPVVCGLQNKATVKDEPILPAKFLEK